MKPMVSYFFPLQYIKCAGTISTNDNDGSPIGPKFDEDQDLSLRDAGKKQENDTDSAEND